MTITWGEVQFTGPHILNSCEIPNQSGLYAIMVKEDPINQPKNYTIIYFGESENFSERVTSNHHKFDCWTKQVGSDNLIFYGLHIMENSTEEQRGGLELKQINRFNPSCND